MSYENTITRVDLMGMCSHTLLLGFLAYQVQQRSAVAHPVFPALEIQRHEDQFMIIRAAYQVCSQPRLHETLSQNKQKKGVFGEITHI